MQQRGNKGVCLSFSTSLSLTFSLSLSLSTSPSIYLYLYYISLSLLSFYPSTFHLSVFLSLHLSLYLFSLYISFSFSVTRLFIYLSIYLSIPPCYPSPAYFLTSVLVVSFCLSCQSNEKLHHQPTSHPTTQPIPNKQGYHNK